jgi:APA family basic amino acid/polyamine antiporter
VPGVPWLPLVSVAASVWLMLNLPVITWVRFLVWMAAGLVMYFTYGMRRATLPTSRPDIPSTPASWT